MGYKVGNKEFIIKKKIDISNLFDEAKDTVWIILREPTLMEMTDIQEAIGKDQKAIVESLYSHFNELIVEHNLDGDNDQALPNEEIRNMIFARVDVSSDVISKYVDEVLSFRNKGKAKKR